jgi:hypothetical protein
MNSFEQLTSNSLLGPYLEVAKETAVLTNGSVLGPFDSKGFPNFLRKVTKNNKTLVLVNLSTKVEVVFYKFIPKIPIYNAQNFQSIKNVIFSPKIIKVAIFSRKKRFLGQKYPF